MNIELDKKDLLMLVNSVFPKIERCIKLEALNYMEYTGDQHNIEWKWNQEFLNKLNENELYELYKSIKEGE
jgi:hypothetical protein